MKERGSRTFPLSNLFPLAISLILLSGACVQAAILPVPPTPSSAARTEEAPDLSELTDQLASEYGMAPEVADSVAAMQIETAGEQPLYVAFTLAYPPEDPSFRHKVSIHTPEPEGWLELSRVELGCVAYLTESSLNQVEFGPNDVWLTVQGLAGAHSGCFELLRWNGESLAIVISEFSSSPDAGYMTDLNGDGQLDLLLNNSDPYIFCYACGVRQYWAQLFYWDGHALVEVTPTLLSDEHPAELRALNDRAIELAEASLFADALSQIEQAEAIVPEDATVVWNAVWIRHHLEASRMAAATSPFPLLGHVFAGDWETAFDSLWTIGLPTFSSSVPIPNESAASGFEQIVGELLAQYADTAMALQPERAAIHALSAWGRFLLNPNDPAVQADFRRAAELAQDDSRFSEIVAAFEGRIGTIPVAATPAPPPNIATLTEQLAAEYGMAQDPTRNVAAQPIDAESDPPLVVAFTYGLPPDSFSKMHKVSIHAAMPGGWSELSQVELACVNYLDEFSLELVMAEPANIWLSVQGGAGAHGGCLELLRWDGQELSVVISSFNSIPDAGSVTDLNGDGQVDLLLNNSDPYIFCYACGLQLYKARFFHWEGQTLVEAAPRSLAEDHPSDLRALNSNALELAETGLYADALAQIEQAQLLAPADKTVHWNAVWIRHHLDVSRQIALASPFPLLSHVFAGDWELAFDALWTIGMPTFSGDTPIPSSSAAFGFEQTVGELLVQYADNALTLQPERAAIHAVGAWGRFLLDHDDPAVCPGFQRAAELASADSRFAKIVVGFSERTGNE